MLTSINRTRLFVVEEGVSDGPPIVLIHGFPFNHRMWDPQIPVLKDAFRVLRYDQRGHGQSDAQNTHFTIDFLVDDLVALLDLRRIEKAVLCGLSMGGYVALRTAERYPDRLLSLILCDTRSEADSNEAKVRRSAALKKVQAEGVPAFAESFLTALFPPASFEHRAPTVDTVRRMILQTDPKGIAGTILALASRTDTTAVLPTIKAPTLIVVGQEDTITPPSAAQAMKDKIPDAELQIIPDAGHVSNMDQPARFNEILTGFLNRFH